MLLLDIRTFTSRGLSTIAAIGRSDVLFGYDVNMYVGKAFVVKQCFQLLGEEFERFQAFLVVGE